MNQTRGDPSAAEWSESQLLRCSAEANIEKIGTEHSQESENMSDKGILQLGLKKVRRKKTAVISW